MNFRVGVGAAVAQDRQVEIKIRRFAKGRKDHATGRDPAQNQRIDAFSPQHDVEIAARKGTHSPLGDQ